MNCYNDFPADKLCCRLIKVARCSTAPGNNFFADFLFSLLTLVSRFAICKFYGTSTDYLLGLTDIDPSDEARKQRQRLTEEEQNEMHRYEEYLLWKRKK